MASLLEELFTIITEKKATAKKVTKKTAKSVYRRDYLRTRNKLYRKYEPEHADTPNE